MKQSISPWIAAVVIGGVVFILVLVFLKRNFGGPPPAPKIPMAIVGGDAKPVATREQMGGGVPGNQPANSPMPGAEQGAAGGAPRPGGGMSPGLPGGSGGMQMPGSPR